MDIHEWQCECGETFYTLQEAPKPKCCAYCASEQIEEV